MALYRLLTPDEKAYIAGHNPFTDVEHDAWFGLGILSLYNLGIVSGYPDGTFQPNGLVTRAELATILVQFFLPENAGAVPFSDVPENHWAYQYIADAYADGFIYGYPDGTFRPDDNASRVEFAVMVNRILSRSVDYNKLSPELQSQIHQFSDMPESYWGFNVMVEASNSHNYSERDTFNNEYWTEITGNGIQAPENH